MKRVVVHIDRLVLRGFAASDGDGIALGLRQELGRLLADPAMANRLAAGGNVARLRLGAVPIQRGAAPCEIGTGVGRGIGDGMMR